MTHWRHKHEQDLTAVDIRDMRATVATLELVIDQMWKLMTVTETIELNPAALDVVKDVHARLNPGPSPGAAPRR